MKSEIEETLSYNNYASNEVQKNNISGDNTAASNSEEQLDSDSISPNNTAKKTKHSKAWVFIVILAILVGGRFLLKKSPDPYQEGYNYFYGLNGYQKDLKKSFEYYMKSAEKGNGDAMNWIGLHYLFGYGVDQDYNKALQWLTKANQNGSSDSNELYIALAKSGIDGQNGSNAVEYTEALKDIKFRDIDWYSTKEEIEKQLGKGKVFDDNAITYKHEGFKHLIGSGGMSFYPHSDLSYRYIDNAGIAIEYSDIEVAGYTPSKTVFCYLYPLTEDQGSIRQSQDEAELYLGCYLFLPEKFHACNDIYKDLQTKLINVYGNGNEKQTKDDTTTTWTDNTGNKIFLRINEEETYVSLAYYSAGADEKLNTVARIVKRQNDEAAAAEKAQKAAEERETMTPNENTEGL